MNGNGLRADALTTCSATLCSRPFGRVTPSLRTASWRVCLSGRIDLAAEGLDEAWPCSS
jgi:hypothetical protein